MGKKLTIGIYKITSPTGNVYIGQSRRLFNRFSHYRNLHCRKQVALYNSLLSHGPENHSFEIIDIFPNDTQVDVLNNYEIFVWSQYKEAGIGMLNIKEPGSSGRLAESTKKKMSIGKIGSLNPMYGVKMSLENIERLRRNWAGSSHPTRGKDTSGANNHASGEFIKEWDSGKVAAKALNLSQGNISNVCVGRRKTEGNFMWKFKNVTI